MFATATVCEEWASAGVSFSNCYPVHSSLPCFGDPLASWVTSNYGAFAYIDPTTDGCEQPTIWHTFDPYPTISLDQARGQVAHSVETAVASMCYSNDVMTCVTVAGTNPHDLVNSNRIIYEYYSSTPAPVQTPVHPITLPYRIGPGTNICVRSHGKYRSAYSGSIKLELEQEFCMSEFITADSKAYLAATLNLTERQIKIWFQNRRMKKKRRDKSTDPMLMSTDSDLSRINVHPFFSPKLC